MAYIKAAKKKQQSTTAGSETEHVEYPAHGLPFTPPGFIYTHTHGNPGFRLLFGAKDDWHGL
jgi:hypothetical protein